MADFEQAVALVLKHEGGYTPGLPDDPGGETNFGIAKKYHPNVDIKNLTAEQAKEIYQQEYWRFDDVVNQSTANCLLDCAVNQGLAFAQELHELYVKQNVPLALQEVQLHRLMRYASSNKTQFYHAWFSRVLDV